MKKLICFPCAGGNAQSFEKLGQKISCAVISVEYSGHWSRYTEPQYDSIETCIESQLIELKKQICVDDEIFLLGHSMGAVVAFEVGKKLLAMGYQIKRLFLLACLPPDETKRSVFEFQNDESIKKFLKKIRQISDKVLNSIFFVENLLPPTKNDLNIFAAFIRNYSKSEPIGCNIICLYGDQDSLVDTMEGWNKYTSISMKEYCLSGGHFFFCDEENEKKIIELINKETISS